MNRFPKECPAKPLAVLEAVLEELGDQRLGIRQGGNTIAHVARRQDPKLSTQHARTTAVVGNGDDCGEVVGVLLEAAQQGGKPMPAADGYNLGAAAQESLRVDGIDQALVLVAMRRQDRDDGLVQFPDGEQDQANRTRHVHRTADIAGNELEG